MGCDLLSIFEVHLIYNNRLSVNVCISMVYN